jgi:hypothetical protein
MQGAGAIDDDRIDPLLEFDQIASIRCIASMTAAIAALQRNYQDSTIEH